MKKCLVLLAMFCMIVSMLQAAGKASRPAICDRTGWSARAPQCTISVESNLTRAVIHHTAGSGDYNVTTIDDSKVKIRAIQNYHMDTNGWCDIGYNFLTDKLGNNFEGRYASLTQYSRGAHDGVNNLSFGFNMMGYYHTPYNQTPTCEGRAAMYQLIAWRMPNTFSAFGGGTYGTKQNIGYICGHRDAVSTACPGDLLYAYIGADINAGEIRNEVNSHITDGTGGPACGGNPTPTPAPSPTPGPVPATPSNLKATVVSSTQINLTWNDNSNNETNFVVERKKGSTGTYAVVATLSANTTSYSSTGLAKNTTYYYRVKAFNANGDSAYSNEVYATTPRK